MNIWLRTLGLLVTIPLILNAIRGTQTGTVYSGYAIVEKERNPVAFWVGVLVSFAAGMAALIASLFGS